MAPVDSPRTVWDMGLRALLRRDYAGKLVEPALALIGIAAGGVLRLASNPTASNAVWAATVAVMLIPLTVSVVRALARGRLGVDLIALIAMAGALALGEYLAGAVIALMLAGGNALEAIASTRARRELTALLARAPAVAHRRSARGWEEVAVDALAVGDVVLVRRGEVVPADGAVESERALVDESTLTGEPLPAAYAHGETVHSGTANAGDAFELRATRRASDSAYAALVRLVEAAEQHRAPFVRLADRYAIVFLPVTLIAAAVAWIVGGDPVRALAVVVVATPCPLILAAPIAFVAGLSRAASTGVIVKGGGAIERLGAARTVLLDKTGTLTFGTPAVERVVALDGLRESELLRLTASLDQLSSHVLAEAIVRHAEAAGIALSRPTAVRETPGSGVEGDVDGRQVVVGSRGWLGEHAVDVRAAALPSSHDGQSLVMVGVDGALAGALVMGDRLRGDAHELIRRLRGAGVRHVAMVTGDRREVAEAVGDDLALDRVYAEQTPEDKLDVVTRIRATPELQPVVMVGDGINDAPALALADVGVAIAGSEATVSSEAADAVIVNGRVERVADAIAIGRRTNRIARQSVRFGIGLSVFGMGLAIAGLLVPVAGALFQEAIDVAVILNALRALRG
jgi:heavy metal translocating P-type ATPase